VAKEIHVSLAQINIAVVHEQVQPLEIDSVSRSFTRCTLLPGQQHADLYLCVFPSFLRAA